MKKLVDAAKAAREGAYCPYSKYPVGAAVLGASGKIYTGANVENASFGLSMCAERVAIFNAVSGGEKKLDAIAIACRAGSSCGACRQVMVEFSSNKTILLQVDVPSGRVRKTTVFKLLPDSFDPVKSGLRKR